ncbi:MAG: nucleoside triphosphate pyrophosphohydrolase [Pseudomonadota bacterium]
MSGHTTAAASLEKLLQIMAMLRDPSHGCPWDLQQTFASIAPHTLEEVYEVIDAIETDDGKQLQSELGDLLFQIVFYAQLGKEQRLFDFAAIAEAMSTKLLQRHPHVFPDASLASFGKREELSSDQVVANWEQIKAEERRQKQAAEHPSMLDDVPHALPAVLRAAKLQKRAANVGFDWPEVNPVILKIREELSELEDAIRKADSRNIEEEFGDLLFTMVNLSRHLAVNPETSLRQANRKFENRFRYIESTLKKSGVEMTDLSQDELDKYWIKAKQAENENDV